MSAESEQDQDPSEVAESPPAPNADAPAGDAPAGDAPAGDAPAGDAPASASPAAPAAPKKASGAGMSLSVIALTVGIVAAIVLLLPRNVDLIIDNGGAVPLRVFVNGTDHGKVEPEDSRVLSSIPSGAVVLTAHEVGPDGQKGREIKALEGELTAPLFRQRRRAYIWNVDGMSDGYWVTTHGYGDRSKETFVPEAYVPPGQLFAIPGRCEPLLNDTPRQVRVSGGDRGATRDVLFSSHRVQRLMMEKKARKLVEAMGTPRPKDR